MKYFFTSIVILLFFSACQNRGHGAQEITYIPNVTSTDKVYVVSSIPENKIARSAYISIEFSSYIDIDSFKPLSVTLKDKLTNENINLSLDVNLNWLNIKPLTSLQATKTYILTINDAKDFLGNSISKKYTFEFLCIKNFWQSVKAGETHSLALSKDGYLYFWGDMEKNNYEDNSIRSIPIAISKSQNPIEFDAGSFSNAIIQTDNSLLIIGNNQLDNNIENFFSKISVGNEHSVIIKQDSTLWSWGANNNGQLGNSGVFPQSKLTQEYFKDSNWLDVSAGENYTIALKNDGTLWGWGNNEFGQIGNALYKEIRVPVQEDTNATDWKIISAGASHSSSIKEDGTLWSWGRNDSGELGNGTNESSTIPTQEITASTWKSLSVGYNHTIAIMDDGSLWTWGNNHYGQLGNNSTKNSNIPIQISTDMWRSASAGKYFSIAIKDDGTIWSWGYNAYKQLGLGDDINDTLLPTEIK